MYRRGFVIGLGAGLLIASTIALALYISFPDKEEIGDTSERITLEEKYAKEKAASDETETDNGSDSGENIDAAENDVSISEEEKREAAAAQRMTAEQELFAGEQEQTAMPAEAATVQITVAENASSDDIANELHIAGVIEDPQEFSVYLDKKGLYIRYKPGTYELRKDSTYNEILEELAK